MFVLHLTRILPWHRLACFALLLFFTRSANAADDIVCSQWMNKPGSQRIQDIAWKIWRTSDPAAQDVYLCHARVTNRQGKRVFSITDYGMSHPQTLDINNDGHRDLVIESYSGGAHCCWTFSFLSTTGEPGLIAQIYNERALEFTDRDRDGKLEIWAGDGSFDYFDGLSHAGTYFPIIVLQINGRKIAEISPRFRGYYDEEIAKARQELTPEMLRSLREAKNKNALNQVHEDVGGYVLQIVLSYLYSGRRSEAQQALYEMWPTFDQERMWQLILRTRAKGLRRYVNASAKRH